MYFIVSFTNELPCLWLLYLLRVQHLNLIACDLAFKEKLILHHKRQVQLVIFLRFAVNFKSVISVTFAK